MTTVSKTPKISIIAIAKDESPYLPEWIHHYLYLGVASIFIAVNRTSDNSPSILKNISQKYSNVHFESVDWIDKSSRGPNNKIQQISYSYLSDKAQNLYNPDYFFYLDVDEFWFSPKYSTLTDYLRQKDADIISFHWFCQAGEPEPFLAPFKAVKGSPHGHVKTLISKHAFKAADSLRCHVPLFHKEDYQSLKHINGKGNKVEIAYDNQGFIKEVLKKHETVDNEAYILHRMIRSEKEYVSNVLNGNPEGEKVKRNRTGFYLTGQILPFKMESKYYRSLNKFISRCSLDRVLADARNKLLDNRALLETFKTEQLNEELENAFRALSGCSLLDEYIDRIITENESYSFITKNIESLRDKNADKAQELLSRVDLR